MRIDLEAAVRTVRRFTPATPLTWIPSLNLWIKDERWLPTGSFKLRGAAVWLAHEPRRREIITASSGNHASALQWLLTVTEDPRHLTVVVSTTADPRKVQHLSNSGCEVIECQGNNEQRDTMARRIATTRLASFCSSHDDPYVIAGQSTLGLEILAELPNAPTIYVPVGGGGLYAGTLLATAHLSATTKIVGVQPTGANAMARSLSTGNRIQLEKVDTVCDALRASAPGRECLRLAQQHGGTVIEVPDCDIADAHRLVQEHVGPTDVSAAVSIAGALRTAASSAVCVLTGAQPAAIGTEACQAGLRARRTSVRSRPR